MAKGHYTASNEITMALLGFVSNSEPSAHVVSPLAIELKFVLLRCCEFLKTTFWMVGNDCDYIYKTSKRAMGFPFHTRIHYDWLSEI